MLTEGMYLADRYEIVGRIGTGGMSDVYKAMDHILGRFVAIKVLKAEFSDDVNFVTKFRSEAQAAAGLEHSNIVNIYDVGSENGIYFIVMEYVEGITLKSYIERKIQLTYKEAVSIAIQVGRGIEAAHNKHIIHRDIKPQNIMISTDGQVKVTDFGIARAANHATIASEAIGSVHYTSPEQARNGFVDGKSDIYSLGIVMYEMVTGRVPFDGDTTVSVAIQHLQEEMKLPSIYAKDLPRSMEKVILKCTQKSPDRRYESISDLLVDLKKVLISPHEDFVMIAPSVQDKTRVIPKDEVETIKRETGRISYEEKDEKKTVRTRSNDTTGQKNNTNGKKKYTKVQQEEEDEEEGFLNPKMEKAVTIMGIIAAIIIIAIIVTIIVSATGMLRFGKTPSNKNPGNDVLVEQEIEENQEEIVESELEQNPEQEQENTSAESEKTQDTVTMISLLGKTEEEARAALEPLKVGLRVSATENNDDYEKGQIISQNIQEGTEIPQHETIEVVVSAGVGEVEAPYVVGEDDDTARMKIEDSGLSAARDYAHNDTIPEGKVISQNPEAGTKMKKGDTITYIVSRGAETIRVPDVTSKSREEAIQTLEAAGFVVNEPTEENHDIISAGNVIRQSPQGGEYKNKGASIHLVVSLGKEAEYYSYKNTFDKPAEKAKFKVELTKSESDEEISAEVIDNGNNITISATNIKDCNSGTLTIYWTWKEKEVVDETGIVIQEEQVHETTTGPLNVSFQKQ